MRKAIAAVAAVAAAGGVYLATPTQKEVSGHLYVMRGLLGGFPFKFSTGVDNAADKAAAAYNLTKAVKSWRTSYGMCELAYDNWRKDKKPVFLLGHSLGANEVSDVAICLKGRGVPVTFAFYYDPTPFVACVPDNVKFATSWRRSFPFDLGGGTIKRCVTRRENETADAFKKRLNRDIANITVQTRHTVLDDLPSVHDATLKRIGVAMKGK